MDFTKHAEGQTSVKVHHQPGGQSSFSLSHDTGEKDDRFGDTGKVGGGGKAAAPSGVAGSMNAPSNASTSPWATEEVKKEEAPNAGPGSFTTVKYSGNPPGGKSSGPLW